MVIQKYIADSRAVVFDFGGVLLEWNPHFLYRPLFNYDDQAIDRFLHEIGFTAWNMEQDRGRSFSEGVADLCQKFPHHCRLIQAYADRWEESLSGPIQGSVDLLLRLHQAGFPLYGLSNWNSDTFRRARPCHAFFDCFKYIMVSGDVGLVKPDPRIFHLFLERTGLQAPGCHYIDDSLPNVEAAARLGFDAFHFTSPDALARYLASKGLLKTERK